MKQQKVEEYLKERLLVNDAGVIDSTFDELVEVVKMLCRQKCVEQKVLCIVDYTNVTTSEEYNVVYNAILDTSIPEL